MKNIANRNGFMGALVVVLFYTMIYFVKKELLLNPWIQWGPMVFYVAFMYKAQQEDCALYGAERDFRAMVRIPFITFILINLGYWLWYYASHLADPSLITQEIQVVLSDLEQQLSAGTGDPQQANDIRMQIAEHKKVIEAPTMPLLPVVTRMAFGSIGGFLLAALLTAIKRMNN
ncbi:MAG: hypothetical protein J0L99_01255 [Chitinophagales bacterium]|nr:hypothetical protein [Chitinophagales bacterium]